MCSLDFASLQSFSAFSLWGFLALFFYPPLVFFVFCLHFQMLYRGEAASNGKMQANPSRLAVFSGTVLRWCHFFLETVPGWAVFIMVGWFITCFTSKSRSPHFFQNVCFLPCLPHTRILLCKIKILSRSSWFSSMVGLNGGTPSVCLLLLSVCLLYFVVPFAGKVAGSQGDALQHFLNKPNSDYSQSKNCRVTSQCLL